MNPEYILDVLGLLDDDLIREAETCTAPGQRSGYRGWMTLAACLVVVIALGYVFRNGIGMGGGGAGGGAAPEFSGTAPSTSSGGATQGTDGLWNQGASSGGSAAPKPAGPPASAGGSEDTAAPGATEPQSPSDALEEGQTFAVLADGTVYQATEEAILLEPAESDVQYTTGGKEEDAGFLPAGTAYVMLEPGVAAVFMEETGLWRVFISVQP